ncbi:MAG TPA: hypothetical protein VF331_00525 [Polyangiales bacterium]
MLRFRNVRFAMIVTGLAGLGHLAACASEPTPPAEYPAPEAAPAASVINEPPPAPEAPPPAPPVQVVAADNTPLEGAVPSVRLRAPRDGQVFKTDKIEVQLEVKNWALSPDGSHVHLIVDNEPYIAIRDVSKPIDLVALVQKELHHELAEGTHVLRVFPGRGHHESVKEPGAFDVKVFHFKKKSADFKFDAKAPLLTYSRPKGCVDLGQRMLVDFYVSNAKLSATEDRVHYTIDGTLSGDIVAWTPHYVENLSAGEHQLRLQLVNAAGQPVAGPFNDVTRTVKVAQECKPAAAAAAPPAPAAAAPAAAPSPSPTGTPAPAAAAPPAPMH